jgi:adenylosuccinate lyase
MSIFENISPLDTRYYRTKPKLVEALSPFLTEASRIKYQAKVEAALAKALSAKGLTSPETAEEIALACEKIDPQEVYEEEKKIHHDIRALANTIRNHVSEKAKPFVHFTLTSYDVINTAESLRFREATEKAILPLLIDFEKTLISLARREAATLQMGRTHGQHAVPITFGFALSEYVSRIGNSILRIKETSKNLRGKISGAVGAYNTTSLFFEDPEAFELEVLKQLNLEPGIHSTQLVEPEYTLNYIHSIISCFGVLANLADDMRHLQRTEINEVAEAFAPGQVGSSTMPHKRNPWNFEHVKSMWKQFSPRILTVYSDQISEHQRDLTNSASSRFLPEIIAAFYDSLERLNTLMKKLVVDNESMSINFEISKENIIAEPAYILLAFTGHPNAHETIRSLTLKSKETKTPLKKLILENEELKYYINKLSEKQKEVLENPEKYTGISEKKTEKVCSYWESRLELQ